MDTEKEFEIVNFVISKFIKRKYAASHDWNDIMYIIEKIENHDNGSGIKLKTSFVKLDDKLYNFSIISNQNTIYSETFNNKNLCVLKCISNFCKDWYILEQIKK